MNILTKITFGFVIVSLTVAASGQSAPGWTPGDPHKMHFPQLPDPNGWDVSFSYQGIPHQLADDWQCSQSGPVDDIHFWVSWDDDQEGFITSITSKIYSDNPIGVNGWSEPAQMLWERTFNVGEFDYYTFGQGSQGWLDPISQSWNRDDHDLFYQIDIDNIIAPFVQQQGTIYWLSIEITAVEGLVGWKTSLDHWNDDAVVENNSILTDGFSDLVNGNGLYPHWYELRDPRTQESLDLAFVITPEPATLLVLGLGLLLSVLARKRKGSLVRAGR